jgi:hypothetical protein
MLYVCNYPVLLIYVRTKAYISYLKGCGQKKKLCIKHCAVHVVRTSWCCACLLTYYHHIKVRSLAPWNERFDYM